MMANIFQQYLGPAKSVMEYSSELDAADQRKQSLQQNALTLAASRQKYDEGVQGGQRAAQLRNALSGLAAGATDEDRIRVMRGTSTPEGFAAADSLEKSLTERGKAKAGIAKDEAKTAKTNLSRDIALHDFHAQKLAQVQTPADAAAWAQEGQALGLFKEPGQFERGMTAIQQASQDPQAFAKWKQSAMQGGQSITEQLKQQAAALKQAEEVRQFGITDSRIRTEGIANRGVQVRGQNMIDARAKAIAAAGSEAMLPDDTVAMMAQQYLAGDTSVMQNLGRGAQGATNIIKLRKEITRQNAEQGKGGADMAAQNSEYFGTKAGQRAAGTRIANVEMASNEAESLIPLARQASTAVARSSLLPFGKAQVMFDTQTNDPALRQFAAANNALVNVYSRAISPSGTPTVADKEHAREMISTAMDDKSYQAVLDQMQMEITAAKAAPQSVRKAFNAAVTGKGGHGAPATSSAGKPSLDDIFGKK